MNLKRKLDSLSGLIMRFLCWISFNKPPHNFSSGRSESASSCILITLCTRTVCYVLKLYPLTSRVYECNMSAK